VPPARDSLLRRREIAPRANTAPRSARPAPSLSLRGNQAVKWHCRSRQECGREGDVDSYWIVPKNIVRSVWNAFFSSFAERGWRGSRSISCIDSLSGAR
jgi:hypothetical protein